MNSCDRRLAAIVRVYSVQLADGEMPASQSKPGTEKVKPLVLCHNVLSCIPNSRNRPCVIDILTKL